MQVVATFGLEAGNTWKEIAQAPLRAQCTDGCNYFNCKLMSIAPAMSVKARMAMLAWIVLMSETVSKFVSSMEHGSAFLKHLAMVAASIVERGKQNEYSTLIYDLNERIQRAAFTDDLSKDC